MASSGLEKPSSSNTAADLTVTPPPPKSAPPSRGVLSNIADDLVDQYQIGFKRDIARQHRRYANLRTEQIFIALVNIYTRLFETYHRVFKHVLDIVEPIPLCANKHEVLARAYISCWFWDLYVSIQQSVWKISSTAFQQYYSNIKPFIHERYDPFLYRLNAIIRPTHTPHALADVLWIPIITERPQWNTVNPFNIPNWLQEESYIEALLEVMDSKNNDWQVIPLSHDTFGRPAWLFDWHNNEAYAWFPSEGHYSQEDIALAYILGIPCTPAYGPCDVDEWTMFPHNVYDGRMLRRPIRTIARRFYGSAEFRQVEDRVRPLDANLFEELNPYVPDPKKRKTPASSTPSASGKDSDLAIVSTTQSDADPQDMPIDPPPERVTLSIREYRITDWCYHSKVIFGNIAQLRNKSLRSILLHK